MQGSGIPEHRRQDVMELLASHTLLAEGDTVENCRKQALQFFDKTSLVRYDRIVIGEHTPAASDSEFSGELDRAVEQNRRILKRFVDELGTTGFNDRADLLSIEQGYQSKILHIIAHFLDGFVGIDSVFYNLVEDSHWLSGETGRRISENPERFRLLYLTCYSLTPRDASLLHT
jgi:hypothetical protein